MEDLQGLACDDWPSFYFHGCFVGGTCLCSAVGDLGLQFILKGSRRWLYSDWAERIQESNHMAKKRKAKKTKVKRKRSAKKNNPKKRAPRKPDLRLVAKRNEAAEIPRALTPHDIFDSERSLRKVKSGMCSGHEYCVYTNSDVAEVAHPRGDAA